MTRNLIAEIEDFARKESGVSPKKVLNQQTTIEDDLDVTGDDAVEFMGNFFDKFGVDYQEFVFDRYFTEEGLNPFKILLLPFPSFRKKMRKVPITLEMLAKAVQLKRWDAEKIEGQRTD
ncbi:hypothetical protein C8244_03430 [Paracidovorax avenae]|uniref:DUF1493 family protein n=1 Tax=Paracidovorax avenae TaxID=80867 RepID=UPI000D16E37B|nr:DUF1493 family protein [Paracidovorax avenae]AVS76988.1 hypothetical protein C8234_02190 [Paracidovorax avenae]AVS80251.1 hypothetical protein C8237_03515 [Paracidovorax avenae]AVT15374.1 hypothetical protein C8244_03430 [Paracidovorax avenae]